MISSVKSVQAQIAQSFTKKLLKCKNISQIYHMKEPASKYNEAVGIDIFTIKDNNYILIAISIGLLRMCFLV